MQRANCDFRTALLSNLNGKLGHVQGAGSQADASRVFVRLGLSEAFAPGNCRYIKNAALGRDQSDATLLTYTLTADNNNDQGFVGSVTVSKPSD